LPGDQLATKVIYLAIKAMAWKWDMLMRNWRGALNRFIIELLDRVPETI